MKILKATWFSTLRGNIGIVLIENETEQQSARISPVLGHDETYDANVVAEFGSKLTQKQAESFFGEIKNYKQ